MMRLNVVLLVLLIGGALYLVRTQYESRQLFMALEVAKAQAHKLEIEHQRLQVEQHTQATTARIERLARERLQMRMMTPAIQAPQLDEVAR
jgi:cell division protein FtsL